MELFVEIPGSESIPNNRINLIPAVLGTTTPAHQATDSHFKLGTLPDMNLTIDHA